MSPERTCVGCRARAPQQQLVRLVVHGGSLILGRKQPGRGAWIHPATACMQIAERKSAFGRALKFSGSLDTSELRSHLEVLERGVSAL